MSARSLPPFGRELRAWLATDPRPHRWGCNGDRASITIAVGPDAWAWACAWHSRRLVLAVPPGESPARFDWRNCAGHDPILVAQCGEIKDGEIDRLIHALMRDGVRRVLELESFDEHFAGGPEYVAA